MIYMTYFQLKESVNMFYVATIKYLTIHLYRWLQECFN
jgi:hypothetical protein